MRLVFRIFLLIGVLLIHLEVVAQPKPLRDKSLDKVTVPANPKPSLQKQKTTIVPTNGKKAVTHKTTINKRKKSRAVSKNPKSINKKLVSKQMPRNYFSVSSDNIYDSGGGGEYVITVSSGNPWDIAFGTQSWIHLRRNGDKLSLNIDRNRTGFPRDDSFSIGSGSEIVTIIIYQDEVH